MTDITDRRAEAESRLEALRQQRGIATLDGQEFDNAALAAVETELDALTAAEGEAVRRDRQQLARAEMERIAGLRDKLAVTEEHRLEAIDRAETHARGLAEALKEAMTRSGELTRLLRALGAGAMQTDAYLAEHRLSLRLVSALKPVTGLRREFGQIRLPDARKPFDEPWRAAEEAIAAPDITKAKEPAQ